MFRSKLLIIMAAVMLVVLPTGSAIAQEATTNEETTVGTAVVWDDMALSDAITYKLEGIPAPSAGTEYVGWMVSDDGSKKLSTGIMQANVAGSINHTFDRNNPRYTGVNLIQHYNKVVVTEEVSGTDPDVPIGATVYSDAVPLTAMAHVRHLLTSWPSSSSSGALTKLQEQLDVAILHANAAKSSETLTDLVQHTHHVINVIEGSSGTNYDVSYSDPGDGSGIVNHAADRKHAGLAAGQAVSDTVINEHALLVDEYGLNSETWALLARDRALDVIASDVSLGRIYLGPGATTVVSYLEAARDGFLADGGAKQAYVEAQRMATYSLSSDPQDPVPPPATVGDPYIPLLAQILLVSALLLLGTGVLFLVKDKRSKLA
jgi:hypothetical protein